jgi:hypothetical protein
MKSRFCYLFVFIVGLMVHFKVMGQDQVESIPSLVKVGAWFHQNRLSSHKNFMVNLEVEKAFSEIPFLSQGLRADIQIPIPMTITERFSIGYQLKVYPLYGIKKTAYNGLYIGTELGYHFKIHSYNLTGPGIGGLMGYQKILKDKISIGCEIRILNMKNLNSEGPYLTHNYFVSSFYLKLGFKLSKKQ